LKARFYNFHENIAVQVDSELYHSRIKHYFVGIQSVKYSLINKQIEAKALVTSNKKSKMPIWSILL